MKIIKNIKIRFINKNESKDGEYCKTYTRSKYYKDEKPWNEMCDLVFPCTSGAVNLVSLGWQSYIGIK
ncbi:hypothetical protein MKX03_014381 [Papaver bracteatum]|nr:hypothetical protein MKX03_014381 [Papaver bracteatum]